MDADTINHNLNRSFELERLEGEQVKHAAKFVDAGIATSEAVQRMHAEMVEASLVASKTLAWARVAGIGTVIGVAIALFVAFK